MEPHPLSGDNRCLGSHKPDGQWTAFHVLSGMDLRVFLDFRGVPAWERLTVSIVFCHRRCVFLRETQDSHVVR